MLGIILAFAALSLSTFWAGATPVLSDAHQAGATLVLSDAHQASATPVLSDADQAAADRLALTILNKARQAGATPLPVGQAQRVGAAYKAAYEQGLGPGGVEAMRASAICSPSSNPSGINAADCAAIFDTTDLELFLETTEFGPNSHDRRFQLPQTLWRDGCAVIVDSMVHEATVLSNYATILRGMSSLLKRCAADNRVAGYIEAGGLYIVMLNPATAGPELKKKWDQLLHDNTGVAVPPGCCSSADYFQLVRNAHGTATE